MTQPPVEGPSSFTFMPDAAKAVAEEIRDACGVEVLFVGRRGPDGMVHEVEAHAWGAPGAVPVPLHLFQPGDVAIHNHPSGHLEPSEADLSVAATLGQSGVGFYIVSNDAARVRVVVKPHDQKKQVCLDPAVVESALGPGGALARELGEYEDRPQQREMAHAVAGAFNARGIAVVEAGTGTGKSLAYLLPSLMYALDNGERVVISTNTINLQEQVVHKDLPVARAALGREFQAELVKGRSNYVCKRKAQFAREELAHGGQQFLIDDGMAGELREVLAWASASQTGDLQELPVEPRGEVWERVVSEADNCLRVRCPFYEECFFYNSRRRAARANLLVVNHSLLLSDLAVRRETNNWSAAAVLPPARHVVLDEAHHLEEVATRHLGAMASRFGIARLFGRLYRRDRGGRRGVLAALSDKLEEFMHGGRLPATARAALMLNADVLSRAQDVREMIDFLFDDFANAFIEGARLARPTRGIEHRIRLVPSITDSDHWHEEVTPVIAALSKEMATFLDLNRETIKEFGNLPEEITEATLALAMEWRAIVDRMEAVRRRIAEFLQPAKDDECRWVELRSDGRDRIHVALCQAPISVAEALREVLHDRMQTEVLTSATLTVDRDFAFLSERLGLPRAEKRAVESLRLESPFDFKSHVYLGVPSDLGDPRREGFEANLNTLIMDAVAASGGRAFVLFTSSGHMRRSHQACEARIRRMGIEPLLQGQESRDRLLRRFREDETSVLFATSSFWEGVDVRGRALELLVIARLPFAVPDEPIQQAQFEHLKAQGRDPFANLAVPRAVIRLKQGFGRLIRSHTDRGAVIICDERLVTMAYGRRFVHSLPVGSPRHLPSAELLAELRAFYR